MSGGGQDVEVSLVHGGETASHVHVLAPLENILIYAILVRGGYYLGQELATVLGRRLESGSHALSLLFN